MSKESVDTKLSQAQDGSHVYFLPVLNFLDKAEKLHEHLSTERERRKDSSTKILYPGVNSGGRRQRG